MRNRPNKKATRAQTAQEPKAAINPKLLTLDGFAEQIQWHVESVRRACRQGRIAAVKLGRGWRVPVSVAEDILKNGISCG